MTTSICSGYCTPVSTVGGIGFGTTMFILAIFIVSIIVGVLLLYAGLGSHRHGPFTLLEYRDLHETISRCVTCGEIVTAAGGYHPHVPI